MDFGQIFCAKSLCFHTKRAKVADSCNIYLQSSNLCHSRIWNRLALLSIFCPGSFTILSRSRDFFEISERQVEN